VPGAAGLCFSPDGRHLYVADESASAIVVYEMPQNWARAVSPRIRCSEPVTIWRGPAISR